MHELISVEKWCCKDKRYYDWLRDDKNLLTTFTVLQKVGIKRLLPENDYRIKFSEDNYRGDEWNGLSLNDIVVRMISSYNSEKDTSNYYYKFWNRRRVENNDSAVFEILKQVDLTYNSNNTPDINKEFFNDTLYTLIEYKVKLNECDTFELNKVVFDYFNKLKEYGLEHSAYNLIFEVEKTNKLNINRDSMLKTLIYDTIPEDKYWQTRNNAEWIRTFRGNGS
jgi:hypothetical protein